MRSLSINDVVTGIILAVLHIMQFVGIEKVLLNRQPLLSTQCWDLFLLRLPCQFWGDFK